MFSLFLFALTVQIKSCFTIFPYRLLLKLCFMFLLPFFQYAITWHHNTITNLNVRILNPVVLILQQNTWWLEYERTRNILNFGKNLRECVTSTVKNITIEMLRMFFKELCYLMILEELYVRKRNKYSYQLKL